MNVELLEELLACSNAADKLLKLLAEDREDMPFCVTGGILEAYERGHRSAEQLVLMVQRDLAILIQAAS